MAKVTDAILKHPKVQLVSDERRMGDGFWIYLKTGWICASTECGTIHEDSPSKCLKVLRQPGNIIPDPRGPNGGASKETM